MKVGTIPLMVHVPEMAPIRNKMTIAEVTSPILLLMASSKSFHGILKSHVDNQTAIPAQNSNETWLAPKMASLPNMLISNANRMTRVIIGINEMPSLDRGLWVISSNSLYNNTNIKIFLSFLCKISQFRDL